MPVPSPRNKILPARGNYADLLANLGSLGDGEICYALDQDKLYVREGSVLVDVSGSGGGGGAVDSVNGQTGIVVLDAGDVGALASGDNISELANNAGYITAAEAPVQPGDVFSGDYDDLTNKPSVPADLDDLTDVSASSPSNGQFLQWNGSAWAPGSAGGAPVDSVNGETGVVVLDADDISDVTTTNKFATQTELDKLAGIAAGAEVNVNADWNASSGDAQILNKPTLGTAAAASTTDFATAAQGTKADSALQGTSSVDALADVDTTTSAPSNGQFLQWDGANWVPGAASGAPVDSVNGQTGAVVLVVSDLANDANYITAAEAPVQVSDIPTNNNQLLNGAGYITAAEAPVQPGDVFSGDYNDLTNKPSVPADLDDLTDVNAPSPSNGQFLQWNGSEWTPGAASGAPVDSVNGQTGIVVLDAGDVGALASGDNISELANNAGYITAAEAPVQPGDVFSGDYNDLTNKPTIPPAYDDTALENRVTANEGDIAQLQTDVGNIDTFSGDYNDLSNKPAIPANTSDLVNDSGFITAAEAPVQPGDLDSKADLVNGVVPNSQLPSIAITEYLGEAVDELSMLGLDGQKGDWCIRTDTSSTWVVTGGDSSQLASWTELATPASAVTSVNGYTGTVVLGPADVGAAPSTIDLQAVTDNGNTTTNGATFGGGNITLNADGSASFQGTVTASRFWSFDGTTNATFENTTDRVNFAADNKPFFFRDTNNSGPVVQVGTFSGGNWTSNISLNADGSGSFAGNVFLGSTIELRPNNGEGLVYVGASGDDRVAIAAEGGIAVFESGNAAPTISLLNDGGAIFAGNITSGSLNSNSDTNAGIEIYGASGRINIQRPSTQGSDQLWNGYLGSTSTSEIFADGSATFGAGNITLNADGSGSFAAGNISLNADGSVSLSDPKQGSTGYGTYIGPNTEAGNISQYSDDESASSGGSRTTSFLAGWSGSGAKTLKYSIGHDGSASFQGTVEVSRIENSGSGADPWLRGFDGSTETCAISNDGSASFAGVLNTRELIANTQNDAEGIYIKKQDGTFPVILKQDGSGSFAGTVNSSEQTITGAWDLSAGNFWTCGAITVPNPTNATTGTSGLIRLTAAPTGWGSNIKHPGGSAETISSFPAVMPFYVESASVILLGKATQGIA